MLCPPWSSRLASAWWPGVHSSLVLSCGGFSTPSAVGSWLHATSAAHTPAQPSIVSRGHWSAAGIDRWGRRWDQPTEMQWGALGGVHTSSAPRTGLNWGGTVWAAGKKPPAQCSPCRDAARCRSAAAGPSAEHPRCWRALTKSLSLGGKDRPSHVIIPRLWSLFISYQW